MHNTAYLESEENKAFLETKLSPPRITERSADMAYTTWSLFTSRER